MNYIEFLKQGKSLTRQEIIAQQQWLAKNNYLDLKGKDPDGYDTRKDGKVSDTEKARQAAIADGWKFNQNGVAYKDYLQTAIKQESTNPVNLLPITTFSNRNKIQNEQRALNNLIRSGIIKGNLLIEDGIDTRKDKSISNTQKMRNLAIKAGYTYNGNEYVKTQPIINPVQKTVSVTKDIPQPITSQGSYQPNVQQYNPSEPLFHTPITEFVSNTTRGAINTIARKITKNPELTVLHGTTITKLPPQQQQALTELAQYAIDHDMKSLDMNKLIPIFKNRYYGSGFEDRSKTKERTVFQKAFDKDPISQLENTLGSASFHYNDNGDLIITDTYDFNDNQQAKTNDFYAKIRNTVGGKTVSSSSPEAGKNHYEINLGKITKSKK